MFGSKKRKSHITEKIWKDAFLRGRFFSNRRGPRQLNYFPSCRSNILIHVVGQTAGRVRARAYRDWQAERELWAHRQEVGVRGGWREGGKRERATGREGDERAGGRREEETV